jgi:capsular polysaccharide biosynthesis protein
LNSTRSPRFEARLTEELVKRGWKIILSENLNMSEQIELFSGASWIAGVHGAGLSSMVWMNEGSRVTELGPARFVPCYSRLATILSHDYQRVEFTDSDKALENILSILN